MGQPKLYYEVEHRDEMSKYKTTAAHIYTRKGQLYLSRRKIDGARLPVCA